MIELNDLWLKERFDDLLQQKERHIKALSPEHDGLAWCADHARIVDRGIQIIYDSIFQQINRPPALAIIATGGFGRCELAPHSDIDLTVVPLEDDDPQLDPILRAIFRAIHHFLGGKLKYEVGYSYRLIADLPGLDQVTRTGLLDARFVVGSNLVFSTMMESFWKSLPSGEFVFEKNTEREFENLRTHTQPLVVEPHLKEGAGGLRSFQCSNWIRAAIGERAIRPSKGYDQIIAIRNLLHASSQRKQDSLTQTRANTLCEQYDYEQSKLMTITLQSMLELDQVFQDTKERLKESRFQLSDSVIAIRGEARTISPANAGDAAAGIAIATQLGLNVSAIGNSYTNTINGHSAMYAFSQGEKVIRNIDRAGALEVLLPELVACRTLLPGDPSHVYSVFEHSLQVIKHLDNASNIPYYCEVKNAISDLAPVYLAGLLHDAGKLKSQTSGKSHSEEGAEIANRIGEKYGLTASTTDTVSWLISEHLTMSLFIRIRDISLPETIIEFAKLVGTVDRLNMLALLTWADISAVNQNSFTSAQDLFLRELVAKTSEALQGNIPSIESQNELRRRQLRRLKKSNNAEDLDAFLETLPASYLTGTPLSAVSNHIEFVKCARIGQSVVDTHHQLDLAATEVLVCSPDRQGLLSDILGVFYAYDLSIGGLKAYTTSDEVPVAIDSFTVRFNGRPVPTGTLQYVVSTLQQILDGVLTLKDFLSSKGKDPERSQVITRFKVLPGTPAILEIHAPRGRGMPYRLVRLLTEHKLNIQTARIGQWAGSAAASFYVLPVNKGDSVQVLIDEAMADAMDSK